MPELLYILSEDADLLVINKPAGLVCHPTKGDAYSSLISRVRLHLGPDSTPQLINRLDRETSGVVVVGKEPQATREVRRLWETRAVEKSYLAIVHGAVQPDQGTIDLPLGKDSASVVAIKDKVRPDGAPAQTEFRVRERFGREGQSYTLLEIHPLTGRKHQIRIHLAAIGHPIVGDKLYGRDERLYLAFVEGRLTDHDRAVLLLPNQALHAQSVRFTWRGTTWTFQAEPEPWFREFISLRDLAKRP